MMAWRISVRWQCHCKCSHQPEASFFTWDTLSGKQRMKELACIAVYWPRIDADIVDLCHRGTMCRALCVENKIKSSMDAAGETMEQSAC